jgi:DNA mismatch endonuclease, patch repair protein
MDKITPLRRRENMQKIRCRDTKPELIVRSVIHQMGYRYRLRGCKLPGKPDLVFPGRRKVIFVHGCFWHQHDEIKCKEKHIPKTNLEYWLPKLEKNKIRFSDNIERLLGMGWKYMVIWECQLTDIKTIKKSIKSYLG